MSKNHLIRNFLRNGRLRVKFQARQCGCKNQMRRIKSVNKEARGWWYQLDLPLVKFKIYIQRREKWSIEEPFENRVIIGRLRLIFRLRLNRSLDRIPLQKFIEKKMNYWGHTTLIRPRYEPIFYHYTRQKQQKLREYRLLLIQNL